MHELIAIHEKYAQIHTQQFSENIFLSYQWWFLLGISIALWTVWIIFVDKKRLNSILLTGLFTSTTALILDDIGLSMALWIYPYYLFPFSSVQYPIDLAIIPVFYMLLYQYSPQWKAYLFNLTLLTLFAVFVAEPLFTHLGIYIPIHWKHLYSIPGYLLLGIISKGLVDQFEKKVEN